MPITATSTTLDITMFLSSFPAAHLLVSLPPTHFFHPPTRCSSTSHSHTSIPFSPSTLFQTAIAMEGRRTPRQVSSRVQKYLQKLRKFGLEVE
ncbi:hypothetical protein C8F04DRAFT_1107036 [Mycena alexandri]|uniref:Uncharacterized protein n=1 Tax=Mycena alexandri TaxID=1745969 RepID=A0AAD6X2J4_9AGAR|nr:hypothetical protein C8F04DRAFT_1107036 [Mycena alexandri]